MDISTYSDGEKDISFSTKENEEYKFTYFENEEDIPNYVVINSETSEVEFYKDYPQMPVETQQIFKELEKTSK